MCISAFVVHNKVELNKISGVCGQCCHGRARVSVLTLEYDVIKVDGSVQTRF